MNSQPLIPAHAPITTRRQRWSVSDPSYSSSVFSITHSSISSPYSTQLQTTGHRHGFGPSGLISSKDISIFELLRSQCTREQIDTAIGDITHWIDDLDLSPIEDRKKKLVQVLSNVDRILASGNQLGQKQCPADRSHGPERLRGNPRAAPSSKTRVSHRRKGGAKSKGSQTSKHESEDSHTTSNSLLGSTTSFANMLACPFAKHDRSRYILVGNSCTERFGFPTPGKLVEHLKRVHSLRVPCCITCKQRFHGRTRAHAEHAEQLHRSIGQCQPRQLTPFEPEWMNEEQDARFANSIIQGQSSGPEEKWRSIYRQLFDLQQSDAIPSPYYDYLVPGHCSVDVSSTSLDSSQYITALSAPGFLSEPTFTNAPLLPRDGAVTMSQPLTEMSNEAQNTAFEQLVSPPLQLATLPLTPSLCPEDNSPYRRAEAISKTTTVPATSLTAVLLDLNESAQLEVPFSYGVYQGQDSGYQSLEQPVAPEATEPLDFAKFIETTAEDCEAPQQVDEGTLWPMHSGPSGTGVDLAGLVMEPFQFPSDARLSRRGKGLESDL